ncbi:MAG TPA: DUF6058 family natural product biosynthesis protein [Candidatus Baltobacteraceae bacterium]|nr:DUF6058 family natural product biosynthesis protein [Candidatus Baltobacteraceae bacterium]
MTVSAQSDKTYVRAHFADLADLCGALGFDLLTIRREFRDGLRPRPSYVFDDGTEFVPHNYFEQETQLERFVARLRTRAKVIGYTLSEGDCDEIWSDYLQGTYGICLRHVSPENIVEKGYLVDKIETLIGAPREHDPVWIGTLRKHVDALDALERPFCDYDRQAAGGSVSRDRLVTAIRKTFNV